ncbi:glutamate racemase [Clostridium tarantellae]|uniref:Glutamate racemase n=1 Tax=Clostridium tarantellae TaxID=39493 RepID=A0A6I1MLT2_9CLOT|nr:glutamate racemase [Clostridium tarantellae]MPQ44385.1 glutamate racemase [Clostridium tarantellae]
MRYINFRNNPIGFFDSGVGGLSVMKKAIEIMPEESYIYYGDSKNAPYGTKTVDEAKKLTFNAVEFLLQKGAKAIVIACNTATSAAIKDLRNTYKEIPIIGIEPALKPAVESKKEGKIIVMATPMTLAEKKFNDLMQKHNNHKEIISVPCAGLVEYIEKGILTGKSLNDYLQSKLGIYKNNKISNIVLGCTHYPFVKDEIRNIVGEYPNIIDGSYGTARELKRQLLKLNLKNNNCKNGKVNILNSSNDDKLVKLSKKLLEI